MKKNGKNINSDNKSEDDKKIETSNNPYLVLPILPHFTEFKSKSPINQGIILLGSDEINVKVLHDSDITEKKKSCKSRKS